MTRNYLQFTDFSDEKSGLTYTSANIDAANFAAQQTAAAALAVATGALSIGDLTQRTMTDVLLSSPSIPTDPYAQRELKWLVSYQGDTSGKKFDVEIPCANLTGTVVPGTDLADVTDTLWVNYIAAFEDFVRSPDNDTETVTFLSAHVVGRNL